MTAGAGRVRRLTVAEQSALADADTDAYNAYLIARTVAAELMTTDEKRVMPHAEFSDYFAEAAALNLRRNTSDEPRRYALERLIEAERVRQVAAKALDVSGSATAPVNKPTSRVKALAQAALKHALRKRPPVPTSADLPKPSGGDPFNARRCAPPKGQAPSHRPPTVDEITQRVERVMLWFGAALYCLFGIGGLIVFDRMVHDGGWLEIIYEVWWIPAGLAAFFLKVKLEQYLIGRVREDDTT